MAGAAGPSGGLGSCPRPTRWAAVAPDQSGGKLRAVPRRRALSGFGAESRGVRAETACG
jgi:hypothetical protein